MSTRSKGPLAGFGWLKRGISAGYRHPKPLLGAAALLLVLSLLPTLATIPMQFHALHAGAAPARPAFAWIMAGSMLLGLLITPLYAGCLQVIDAAERGTPARAVDIFKPYRQGEALRLIGYGLASMAIYIALFATIIVVAGRGVPTWYMQVLAAQANHQLPPALPHGFWVAMALFVVLLPFITGFYAIGLGEVALRRRSVAAAIGEGLIGALKNLLPLLVLALSALLAWIVLVIVITIVALLLALVAKLVGTWLIFVLIIPLYVAMMLAFYTVMFGVMYYLWRDVCGDEIGSTTPPPFTA